MGYFNNLDLLIKKFESNPFYFVSQNSRFHDDILRQKRQIDAQAETLSRERIELEAEKENVLLMKQEIESSLDIANQLEEIKKENAKRFRLLKKIKAERAELESEKKKLEELKRTIDVSDDDLDELEDDE